LETARLLNFIIGLFIQETSSLHIKKECNSDIKALKLRNFDIRYQENYQALAAA
jgi:hypothetical protein